MNVTKVGKVMAVWQQRSHRILLHDIILFMLSLVSL